MEPGQGVRSIKVVFSGIGEDRNAQTLAIASSVTPYFTWDQVVYLAKNAFAFRPKYIPSPPTELTQAFWDVNGMQDVVEISGNLNPAAYDPCDFAINIGDLQGFGKNFFADRSCGGGGLLYMYALRINNRAYIAFVAFDDSNDTYNIRYINLWWREAQSMHILSHQNVNANKAGNETLAAVLLFELPTWA